jgi:Sperm-tail PG-rich repeat
MCTHIESDINPGPSAYNPVDTTLYKWPRACKFTMREKTKPIGSDHMPGPTSEIVSLDFYKLRAPKYPIFTRTKDVIGNKEVPGPKYDSGDSKLKTMNRDPAYTMRMKLSDQKGERKPGPANYDTTTHNPFSRSPAYTVRRKHSEYANVLILPNDNCP